MYYLCLVAWLQDPLLNKSKFLTYILIICLFLSCSFSGAEKKLRYAPDMISSQLKIPLKTNEILSCLRVFVFSVNCRTSEDKRDFYDVSYS